MVRWPSCILPWCPLLFAARTTYMWKKESKQCQYSYSSATTHFRQFGAGRARFRRTPLYCPFEKLVLQYTMNKHRKASPCCRHRTRTSYESSSGVFGTSESCYWKYRLCYGGYLSFLNRQTVDELPRSIADVHMIINISRSSFMRRCHLSRFSVAIRSYVNKMLSTVDLASSNSIACRWLYSLAWDRSVTLITQFL